MALKRSTGSEWGSSSLVSDAATETTASSRGSFFGSDFSATASTIEGWMYWKRERDCWLKVYAVLRNELLFLTRGERAPRPLVQIAVTWASMSSIGGLCAEGPRGEKMELYLYEHDTAYLWYNALIEAAALTKNLERTTLAHDSQVPRNIRRSASIMYAGTLVEYQEETSASKTPKPWKSVLSATRLRQSWKKRVERLVDRLDTSSK
ncbi:hypothetical protein PybrP1_000507 [[Pythium] brassicae (nom. inval.)]|nr:hypothetical protein PybrP1_000507 [[Pythium] brassicae (nom. inval.)]